MTTHMPTTRLLMMALLFLAPTAVADEATPQDTPAKPESDGSGATQGSTEGEPTGEEENPAQTTCGPNEMDRPDKFEPPLYVQPDLGRATLSIYAEPPSDTEMKGQGWEIAIRCIIEDPPFDP